jgi:hypothetical protein
MNTNTTKNAVITKVIEVPCRKSGLTKSLLEFSLQRNFRYNEKKVQFPRVRCDGILLYNNIRHIVF